MDRKRVCHLKPLSKRLYRIFAESLWLILLFLLLLAACSRQPKYSTPKIRMLAWVGYDEPDFVKPLERELGAQIEIKTYVGGDQMYSLYRSAPPGTFDLVVVDAEYGEKMFREGELQELSRDLWFSPDLFPIFASGNPVRIGEGKVYAAVVRWGALGLVYNTDHVSQQQAQSYSILWSPGLRGKVGMFDWYLPNMGVLSRYLGNKEPYDLDTAGLERLQESLLEIRPQIRSIHANTGDVISDLRTAEVWAAPGIGEWAAAGLIEEGRPIDWQIPKEGGVMWVEALAIPKNARHTEIANRLVQLLRKPEHLARLAWRRAYHSQVPSRTAYSDMSPIQRQILKAENLREIDDLLDRLTVRRLPGPHTNEFDWVRVWTDFKSGQPRGTQGN